VTLEGFPRRTLRADATIYRIHRSSNAPCWFSSDGRGRFDPVGSGLGACYFADQPLGAWIEVFRKRMLLSEDEVLARSLYGAQLGRDLRLADVTSRRALQFGVSASIGADEDYRQSHSFAVAALAAGFAGIRYFVGHDPAQRLYGVALFGETAATAAIADRAGSSFSDDPIPDEVVQEARREFRYRILPTP
jgi:RES domain-containing protein